MATIGFSGSRGLMNAHITHILERVIPLIIADGRSIAVGCAIGADAEVIDTAQKLGMVEKLTIFAIFGAQGNGQAKKVSNVQGVSNAARGGAAVVWHAGGNPQLSPNARLVQRSLAMVNYVATQGPHSGIIAFAQVPPKKTFNGSGLWQSTGSGTWSTCGAAAQLGLPVIVFQIGWFGNLPELPGPRGKWCQAGKSGVWADGWLWRV
jgi:hypothetical protein